MATGDKLKTYLTGTRTGVVEAFIESEGEPSARVLIPFEDFVVDGNLLGLWIINDPAPHVYKIRSERIDLDELVLDLAGIDGGDESITMTLSYPYGNYIKGVLADWNETARDRKTWISDAIEQRKAAA